MRDIIFLFGAGASYGAGGIIPERPPLGLDLYPILERIYPSTWGDLPSDVKEVFRQDFEKGMQIIYDTWGMAIPVLMRELAIYFIQFRPFNKSTLYCKLISFLDEKRVLSRALLSTLNYECVLEFSLLEQGHQIAYFNNVAENTIPVWKLHGSCNMFSHNVQASPDVYYGTGVSFEGGLQGELDSNKVIEHCLIETGLSPAMCLYMRGKPLQVSPSVIADIQRAWAEAIETCKAIFCIGVRPLLEDEHIWRPLGNTSGQLYFVGNERDFEEWRSANRNGSSEFLGSRFNTSFSSIQRRVNEYAIK